MRAVQVSAAKAEVKEWKREARAAEEERQRWGPATALNPPIPPASPSFSPINGSARPRLGRSAAAFWHSHICFVHSRPHMECFRIAAGMFPETRKLLCCVSTVQLLFLWKPADIVNCQAHVPCVGM